MSFDYAVPKNDGTGSGTRWVYIGDLSAGNTILTWTGATLTDGGVWQNFSDRNGKENFSDVDPRAILAKLVTLPITRWNHKTDPAVARIGPMAQDFHAAFGVGPNDTTIASLDAEGVAYASIQALHQIVREKEREIAVQAERAVEQGERMATLERIVRDLQRMVEVLSEKR